MIKIKIANYLKSFSIATLLILSITFFVFALLSGSEQMGGGIKGIVLNSPNALPWLIFLAVVVLAQRKELIGGLIIILLGIVSIFFFQTLAQGMAIFFLISFPPLLLGSLLVIAWLLSQ